MNNLARFPRARHNLHARAQSPRQTNRDLPSRRRRSAIHGESRELDPGAVESHSRVPGCLVSAYADSPLVLRPD